MCKAKITHKRVLQDFNKNYTLATFNIMRKLCLAYCIFLCLSSTAQNVFDSTLSHAHQQLINNKPDVAIVILDSAIKKLENNNTKQEALQLMSNAWQSKGNELKALQYKNEMLILKDSLNTSKNNAAISLLKTNYEEEKQAKEFALQKAKIVKQQYIIIGVALFSLLSILFLFLLHKRKQKLLAANMQAALLEQKSNAAIEILDAEERERKRIATDLHDGVGQMISAVKMNLSSLVFKENLWSVQDKILLDKTLALVDESYKEVRTVSHNMLPNALLKTGLSSAIRTFIEKIDDKKLHITFYTEGLDNRLNNNTEVILYRSIQEIVNNVIKHAKANKLDIALIKDKDGLSCTIEDNGIGFSLNNISNGIGLKNIKNRIDSLQGTVEWDSNIGKGTLVAIHIPC